MNDKITISAKNLGELALPDFCTRCFWIKLKVGNKLPFQIFPGIFSSIDSYSNWFDRHKGPPVWLEGLGYITGYTKSPHYSKFYIMDKNTGITLRGSPDIIFNRKDGSYIIADFTGKLWGRPLTRDNSSMQGQAFEVSISRTYSIRLGEFGGKGDRDLTTADGSRQKAVSRKQGSASTLGSGISK